MRDGAVALKDVTNGAGKDAGLKPGDIVLTLGDESITSIEGLIAAVQSHKPGQEVQVTFARAEVKQTIDVTLGIRPSGGTRHVADDFAGGRSLRSSGFEVVFCHDAHVKPDECGGPVFDADGNFVGINIARVSRTHCYALPADIVEKTANRLKKEIDPSYDTGA